MGNTDSSVGFVGTAHFIRDLQTDINRMLGWDAKGTIHDRKNHSVLKYGGNASSLKLLQWLYRDTTPETRLERKHALYLDLLKMYDDRKKPVVRMEKAGVGPIRYESLEDAAAQNGVRIKTLYSHLRGQNRSCGGFIFKYADDSIS